MPGKTKKLRTLAFDGHTFFWQMDWTYDLDGARIVHLTALHSKHGRRHGQPLLARFVARDPAALVDTTTVLPGDARAAIDHALAHGWDGTRTHWLLPSVDLARPGVALTAPTRLREWCGDRLFYTLSLADPELATLLARDLEVPLDPATLGAHEQHWQTTHLMIRRTRHDNTAVHTFTVADLARALTTANHHAPTVSTSISARKSTVHGPGRTQIPAADIIPPSTWSSVPGTLHFPGPRPTDSTFLVRDPDLHLEFYMYHHDAPDRLWLWTTLRDDAPAIDRRFFK